ncbi:hypothetical protein BGX38DRAFT_1145960 [Terfezia claveryi]|nr:hypothetical protein BGX38DRAFT_1145960 [Terfezia claveryi]
MKNCYLLPLLTLLVTVNLGNARAHPNPGHLEDSTAQTHELDENDLASLTALRRDAGSTLWPRDLGAPDASHKLSVDIQLEERATTGKNPATKKHTTKKPINGGQKKPITKKPINVGQKKKPTTKIPVNGGQKKKPITKKPINGGQKKKPLSCPLNKKPVGGPKKTTSGVAKPGAARPAQRKLFRRTQVLYDKIEAKRRASPLSDKMTQEALSAAFITGKYVNLDSDIEPSLQTDVESLIGLSDKEPFISKAVTNEQDRWSGLASDKRTMKYLDSYLPTKGVIVVQDVSNGEKNKITTYALRFSDVLIKEWVEACQKGGKPASGLKWIIHDNVVHVQTAPLIEEFLELVTCDASSGFKPVKPGSAVYKLTYEAHKAWFLRFLGSGNGSPTAWLVADYTKVLGGKKIVAIYVDVDADGLVFELGKVGVIGSIDY